MERISIGVLSRQTASVLARVQRGETVVITDHGKSIARIVPVNAGHGELDDLVAAGRVIPAIDHTPFAMPTMKAPPGLDAGELIRQLRDEESSGVTSARARR